MKMTPLDVRQKRFATSFRGYAHAEVEAFLELASAELEDALRESNALREQLRIAHEELERHVERERTLKETMVTAQRVSEEVREQARKESALRVAEAEWQAEQIVSAANKRIVDLSAEYNELRRQRAQFESQLESLINSHRLLLESWRSEPTPPPRK